VPFILKYPMFNKGVLCCPWYLFLANITSL